MIDRIQLVAGLLASASKIPSAAGLQIQRSLDKAISQIAVLLSLDEARALPAASAADYRAALDQILLLPDLKKIAKQWEPNRAIAASVSQTELAKDLVELLDGKRAIFSAAIPALSEVKAWDSESKARFKRQWSRFASDAQVKALLKKWDTNRISPPGEKKDAALSHVWSILDGSVPVASKATKKRTE